MNILKIFSFHLVLFPWAGRKRYFRRFAATEALCAPSRPNLPIPGGVRQTQCQAAPGSLRRLDTREQKKKKKKMNKERKNIQRKRKTAKQKEGAQKTRAKPEKPHSLLESGFTFILHPFATANRPHDLCCSRSALPVPCWGFNSGLRIRV